MKYLDLDVEIGKKNKEGYEVNARSESGDSSATIGPFDEKEIENHLLRLQNTLLRAVGLRRQMQSRESESVQEFGRILFEKLFSGGVRGTYEMTRKDAVQKGMGLRIRLNIQVPELASLPWEYLYDADRRTYVCLSRQTPLVRYVKMPQPLQSLHVDLPLRILGMIAKPSDQETLDVEREKERMEKALSDLQAKGLVYLKWLEGQTWRDLQRALQEKDANWHIFHFIGHGGFDPQADEGVIALANDSNKTELLRATQLGTFLADHPSLRLVFLNACEGARGGERDVFSSTASILAGRGLPAVLAMQYEITDRAAIEFTRAFYDAVAQGIPVDTAVADARQAMSVGIANTLEWGTPVLYLRSPDSQIFEPSEKPTNRTPDGVPPPAPRPVEQGLMSAEQVLKRDQLLKKMRGFPSLIAATYARRVLPLVGVEEEQAYQFHQNLRDMAESIVKYLAIVLCSHYRRESRTPARQDAPVERAMQGLRQPSLGEWIELLNKISSLYAGSSEQLPEKIAAFYAEKKLRDTPVSKAIEKMQDWLRVEVKKRSKAPFCYRDFFELVRDYREQPEAWGAQGAALSDREYKERAEILCLALEQTLIDLEALAEYPLVSLRAGRKQIDSSWAYSLDLVVGQNITRNADPLIAQQALESGHLYLCRQAKAGEFEPLLDMYPLMLCDDCQACKDSVTFILHQGGEERLEYHSYSCGHRLTLTSPHSRRFSAFLDAASWQASWQIDPIPPPTSEHSLDDYTTILREPLEDGSIDEEGIKEILAEAMGISAEQAAELIKKVRGNPKEQPVLTGEVSPAFPILPSADKQRGASDEPLASPPSPAHEYKKLVMCWDKSIGSPVEVALFGMPLRVMAVTEEGDVSVWSEDGRPIYREHVQGRPFRVVALNGKVFVGTWRGQLSCFGLQGLLWQTGLGSPVSAIVAGAGDMELVAGTWDGQIVALGADGAMLWRTAIDDGISALSLALEGRAVAAGTYAGYLATVDAQGKLLWLRDMQAPVVGTSFTEQGSAVIVATQDHLVTHIHLHNQEILWEYSVQGSPKSFLLSRSGRRLIMACREGMVLIYAIDAGMEVLNKYLIADVAQILLSPLSQEGHFILARSPRDGLTFLDNRKIVSTVEDDKPAVCATLSLDGQYTLVGHATGVSLYRLARPQLHVDFKPVGELQQGHSTRLKITLQNTGERMARNIVLQLGEVIGCTEIRLPTELDAGTTVTSERQTITPKASGALPVASQISYVDDLGIDYTQTDLHIVDVLPGSEQT